MIFLLKLDYEFQAENLEAAKSLVSEMVISHPDAMIQTQESLGITEESITAYHDSTGES